MISMILISDAKLDNRHKNLGVNFSKKTYAN